MRFEFLDFALDPDRGELLHGEELLTLEPKVMAFLALLLERRGELVTKQELLDALWPGTAVTEGSLTRVVSLARAALAGGGAGEIIRTRHRRGYQIAVPVEVRESPVPGFEGRPAIAVLPFENLSGDPDQEYFADGLVEELTTGLAARRGFPVIARNSTFAYKGKRVDVRQVGRELGARYVVEGSVRRTGKRLRVAVQLIEAEGGHHVWADRYEGELGELFAFQDEIVASVCAAIDPELRYFEPERARRRPGSFEAWDQVLRGFWHLEQRTDESTRVALDCFARALELDPLCAMAHSGRSLALNIRLSRGWDSDMRHWEEALASARRGVELGGDRVILGDVLQELGRTEEGLYQYERALALNPSSPICRWAIARALVVMGQPGEAIPRLEYAIRLSPRDPLRPEYLGTLAQAHLGCKQFEESLAAAKRSLAEREGVHTLCVAAAAAAHPEREAEARDLVERARRQLPQLSLSAVATFLGQRRVDEGYQRLLLDGLRRAGLE